MYDDITYDVILQRMLDRVPDTIDKREGSIIYDALAPAAVELRLMYIEADTILNETFADTASRTNLIKRAAERGIVPKAATKAMLKGVFNINIEIGSRFSLDVLSYTVTEKISDYNFKLECETAGIEGNQHFGTLIPIDYIEGLTSAELTEVLILGEDEEDTEVFRQRYFSALDSQAFGGNVADYKQKVNAISGVGSVKVQPVWNGGGTVKLHILGSDYKKPSTTLINTVQTIIDPVQNAGEGVGLAPVGHVVTVVSAAETTVNIALTLTYQSGWAWADVEVNVQNVIDAYFLELNQAWQESTNLIIRISQIESRLLNVTGIVDVTGTTINGLNENLILDSYSIPVRGTVSG